MRAKWCALFRQKPKMQQEHHKKAEHAADRPSYREARWEKAVKVYTVNQESKYLLVQNVHALGVTQDLLREFSLYGAIEEYRLLDEYPSEPFTDVYWIKFAAIDAARLAKKKLDNHSFFGKDLHVCYAPEYESVQDTREKLQQRRQVIAWKTRNTQSSTSSHGSTSAESAAPGPSSSVATPTGLLAMPTLQPAPNVEIALSHDSHMSQFPVLPNPPVPMTSYPSSTSSGQHNITTGQTGYIETGSGMRPHGSSAGPGMGLHGSGMRSRGSGRGSRSDGSRGSGAGSGMGHGGLGMRSHGSSAGSGTRMHGSDPRSGTGAGGMEGGVFDPAGLRTEDRVAAYLATEGVGMAPAVVGEKRGTSGGSGEVSTKKARKRKRI